MIRLNRKNCIEQIGKKKFMFDVNQELLYYKYLCGNRMSRKEWKKLDGDRLVFTYDQWSEQIKDKYDMFPKKCKIEFSKYLNQCIRERETFNKTDAVFAAATTSALITTRFKLLNFDQTSSDCSFLVNMITTVIIAVIVMLFLVWIMMCINLNNLNLMRKQNIKVNFLEDYKKEIDSMIKE